jgi:uncharacterized membrane protein YgcG
MKEQQGKKSVDKGQMKEARKQGKKRKASKAEKEKKAKKGAKNRRRESTTEDEETEKSSESSDSSSDSDPSSSSSDSESGSSSDSSQGKKVKRRRKKAGEKKAAKKSKKSDKDWELLEELWPVEDRPAKLRDKAYAMGYSLPKLMKLKDEYEKEAAKKGVGSAIFGKDRKPKKKKFKSMKDDGESKLHPARFVTMPCVEPGKFWEQVPVAWPEVYRHLPLQHVGAEGVPEMTIVKMHNRRVPVELHMLRKEAVTEVKHVEEALMNFVAVLRHLHPADYSGLVIQRVMAEAAWAEGAGSNMKERVSLLRKFFDEVMRENSGRAVRQEAPLTCELARNRWARIVAAACPQLSLLGMGGGQMVVFGSAAKPAGFQNRGNAGGGGSGGGQGRGGGAAAGGGGAGNSGAAGQRGQGVVMRTPARFNGVPVCFGYNNKGGCRRAAPGANTCKDGNTIFAHVCNFYIKGVGGKADSHCLGPHSRVGNH